MLRLKRLFVAVCLLVGIMVAWPKLPVAADYMLSIPDIIIRGERGDLLQRKMWAIAPHGVDCGRTSPEENPNKATDCALTAFHEHKAFLVRFDLQGIDSAVAIGLAGTEEGVVTALFFDGDPSGGGGTSITRQVVSQRVCPTPTTLFKSPKGRLNCFPPNPNTERGIMSPTFQAY